MYLQSKVVTTEPPPLVSTMFAVSICVTSTPITTNFSNRPLQDGSWLVHVHFGVWDTMGVDCPYWCDRTLWEYLDSVVSWWRWWWRHSGSGVIVAVALLSSQLSKSYYLYEVECGCGPSTHYGVWVFSWLSHYWVFSCLTVAL